MDCFGESYGQYGVYCDLCFNAPDCQKFTVATKKKQREELKMNHKCMGNYYNPKWIGCQQCAAQENCCKLFFEYKKARAQNKEERKMKVNKVEVTVIAKETLPNVKYVGIKFTSKYGDRNDGRTYHFLNPLKLDLHRGDLVLVDTRYGLQSGIVVVTNVSAKTVADSMGVANASVLREIVAKIDVEPYNRYQAREQRKKEIMATVSAVKEQVDDLMTLQLIAKMYPEYNDMYEEYSDLVKEGER